MKKVEEKIFYHIYPLGFVGASKKNDFYSSPIESLYKVIDWIPHMKHLGVNALYLGPLFESVEHGYDTIDYFKVDRRLGTNETLKNVVKVLHEAGIEVILDGVFNHVGREFFAFKDLQSNLENSKYKDWFYGVNFSYRSPMNDPFTYDTWDGHYNLVKLNLKNNEAAEHLLQAAEYWIREFDIDGIRLDAADTLDFEWMKKLSERTKNIKKDFWLMGEVVHGDYSNWINNAKLDSTTNYESYKGLFSSLNDKNYFEIEYALKRQFAKGGIYEGVMLYNFLDNHDVNRVASRINNKNHLYPLYLMLMTMPGVPSIYYGSEWEIEGEKRNGNDDSLRPNLDVNYMNANFNDNMINHISNLTRIRKEMKSLKYGDYKTQFIASQQFAFVREYDGEKTVVIFNSAEKNIALEGSKIEPGRYYDMLNNEEIEISKNNMINLSPNWGRILKRI